MQEAGEPLYQMRDRLAGTKLSPMIPAKASYVLRLEPYGLYHGAQAAKSSITKDYDLQMLLVLSQVAQRLMKHISGARFTFGCHDELCVVVDPTYNFFGGNIPEIVSVAATQANNVARASLGLSFDNHDLPMFSCQVFSLEHTTKHEFMIWRQKEAWKRFVDKVCDPLLTEKERFMPSKRKLDTFFAIKGKSAYRSFPLAFSRGFIVRKVAIHDTSSGETEVKMRFLTDFQIPLLEAEPAYITNVNMWVGQYKAAEEPEAAFGDDFPEGALLDSLCQLRKSPLLWLPVPVDSDNL